MHIGVIYICNGITAFALTADDNSLRQLRKSVFLRLLSPLIRCKRNLLVNPAYLRFGRKPRRTVLAVAYRLGFDVVEVIDVGKERHAAQHTEHNRCYNNQSCNVWHGFSSCSVKSKSSFQSLRDRKST